MKNYVRRGVAYVVGSILNQDINSVYDYQENKHFSFSFNNSSAYDYAERCSIGITNQNRNQYSLFHYGNRKHIDLVIESNQFNGFDYDCRKHFSGTITNRNISIYDYEFNKYYNYSF